MFKPKLGVFSASETFSCYCSMSLCTASLVNKMQMYYNWCINYSCITSNTVILPCIDVHFFELTVVAESTRKSGWSGPSEWKCISVRLDRVGLPEGTNTLFLSLY